MNTASSKLIAMGVSVALALGAFAVGVAAPAQAADTRTCAQGGACAIGDTGPGGGRVFFVKGNGAFHYNYVKRDSSDECVSDPNHCEDINIVIDLTKAQQSALDFTYLEFINASSAQVPARLRVGALNLLSDWNNGEDPAVATNTRIGWGSKNTKLLVQNYSHETKLTSVFVAADQFVSATGKSDWFLPSLDEALLVELQRRTLVDAGLPAYEIDTGTGTFTSSELDSYLVLEISSISPSAYGGSARNAADDYALFVRGFNKQKLPSSHASKSVHLKAKGKIKAKTIAKRIGMSVPAKSKVTLKIAKRSKQFCKISGRKLVAVKRGKCRVTVTVQGEKPKYGKKLKTVKKKTTISIK